MESWVEYDAAKTDFPVENVPFGVFCRAGEAGAVCGTRVGDTAVDLAALARAGCFESCGAGLAAAAEGGGVFATGSLNAFMALGRPAWREARETLQRLFGKDEPRLRDDAELRGAALMGVGEVEMRLPCVIGDYTDFYASKEHATNVGTMFRGKENALPPNWRTIPIGYHGRASSVVVSGTPVRRPKGQLLPPGASGPPALAPTKVLDFELEVAVFVGVGNALGDPVPVAEADEHIFGLALMNDWSARDVQRYEYVPLGPFGAKNFATTVSPWVVTLDALEPFRCAAPPQDLAPVLPYLDEPGRHSFDVGLQVAIRPADAAEPAVVCRSSLANLYWSIQQMLAHHTVTGCNMRPGDLYGTGTISGAEAGSLGSMLELSWNGTRDVALEGTGETRTFVRDGDEVVVTGAAVAPDGAYRVGFGECAGVVLPAHP